MIQGLSVLLLAMLSVTALRADDSDPCNPIAEVCISVQGRIFCGKTPESFSVYGPLVQGAAEKTFQQRKQKCEESRKKAAEK